MNDNQQVDHGQPTPTQPQPTPVVEFSQSLVAPSKKSNRSILLAIFIGAGILILTLVAVISWAIIARNSKLTTTSQSVSQDSGGTMSAIQMRARDSERRTDILALQKQLEAYYAMNGAYPAVQDVNNSTWRTGNEFSVGTDDNALADPLAPSMKSLTGSVPSTTTGSYTYSASPSGCKSITDATGHVVNVSNYCTGYTLVALLESKDASYKDPSSTSSQTFFIKKNID